MCAGIIKCCQLTKVTFMLFSRYCCIDDCNLHDTHHLKHAWATYSLQRILIQPWKCFNDLTCELMNFWKSLEILVVVIRGYSKRKRTLYSIVLSWIWTLFPALWLNSISYSLKTVMEYLCALKRTRNTYVSQDRLYTIFIMCLQLMAYSLW